MAKNYKTAFVVLLVLVIIGGLWSYGSGKMGFSVAPLSTQPLATSPGQTTVAQTSSGQTPLLIQDVSCGVSQSTVATYGFDTFEQGTKPVITTRIGQYNANGGHGSLSSGITTLSPGQVIEVLLVNNTDYHNAYIPKVTVPCAGTFDLNSGVGGYSGLKENSTLTMTIFNTNFQSISVGTGVSGTTNLTTTAGNSYTLPFRIDSEMLASTNDMTCFLEANNRSSVKTLSLSGFSGVKKVSASLPTAYTTISSNGYQWAYDLSALEGGSVQGSLVIEQQSTANFGADLTSIVRVDCYSKENFIDPNDGLVHYDIQDSNGALKSIAHYTTDINLN